MSTQLYAKIKRTSKYYDQNDWAATDPVFGLPFKVKIEYDSSGYIIQGGPGSRYRLADVTLYVKVAGQNVKLT